MMAAVAGLVLTVIGAIMDPPVAGGAHPSVFHSYLYAYLFWFGVTTGSLALLMLHHVVGGGWGYLIRRFLEAATRLLPWMLVLFIRHLPQLTASEEKEMEKFNPKSAAEHEEEQEEEDFLNGKPLKSKH